MEDFNFFEDFSSHKENSEFTKKMISMLQNDRNIIDEAIGNLEANEDDKAMANLSYMLFRMIFINSLFEIPEEERNEISDEDMEAILNGAEESGKNLFNMLSSLRSNGNLNDIQNQDPSQISNTNPLAGLDMDEPEVSNNNINNIMGNGFPMLHGSGMIPIGSEEDFKAIMGFVTAYTTAPEEIKKTFFDKMMNIVSSLANDEEDNNNISDTATSADDSSESNDDDFDF